MTDDDVDAAIDRAVQPWRAERRGSQMHGVTAEQQKDSKAEDFSLVSLDPERDAFLRLIDWAGEVGVETISASRSAGPHP